jgi:hypothetical protein
MNTDCKVCVAPLYCELNGKCQKGLDREQKGNEQNSRTGMLTMPTLGTWGNTKPFASHTAARNETQ